jgi:hypothetical protein
MRGLPFVLFQSPPSAARDIVFRTIVINNEQRSARRGFGP